MNAVASSVSVVMFVRNSAGTIKRALASVFEQGIPDLELLVLDGGSTDGTVDIIREHQDKIAFWRSAPDGGPTNAINEGVERASGDVICLLPGDDWLEPGALAPVLEKFAADPDLDVLSCGTRYVRIDAAGTMHVEQKFLSPEELEFSMEKILAYPLTAGRFIRRRVYQRLGGQKVEFQFADYEFLVRVCLSGVKSAVLPRLTYTYRCHPQSTTFGNNPESILAMLREGIRVTAKHAANESISPENRRALLDRFERASAHYAWRLLRRGEMLNMWSVIVAAIRANPLWPFNAACLLLFGGRSRGSVSAGK